MRTALIAAVKRTETGQLRAGTMLAGRSVLSWQADLAQALGCERLVCLCETPTPEILELQRELERAGVEFHAIRSNLQLASLVRADDELVILLDGLVADRSLVTEFAGSGDSLRKGIAVLGKDHELALAFPHDFERIDADRHWAGLAILRAGQVHKLAEMPPDSDAISLLLRLALQAHVECRVLDAGARDDGRWMLATSQETLLAREKALVRQLAAKPHWAGPARALAAQIVRRIAPRWLDKGTGASLATAGVFGIGGLALAAAGTGAGGLAATAAGAFSATLAAYWSRLRGGLSSRAGSERSHKLLEAVTDIVTFSALALILWYEAEPWLQCAIALLAIGLSRVLGGTPGRGWQEFWRDRTLHLAIFAGFAWVGLLGEALAVFAIGALLQLMLRPRGS